MNAARWQEIKSAFHSLLELEPSLRPIEVGKIGARDPKIRRRVGPSARQALADLQPVLQMSFWWSNDYQHRFRIRHHYLGASRPGGLFIGNPENMTLDQFAFGKNERFIYEYIAQRGSDNVGRGGPVFVNFQCPRRNRGVSYWFSNRS
jgi:hypothetical protein